MVSITGVFNVIMISYDAEIILIMPFLKAEGRMIDFILPSLTIFEFYTVNNESGYFTVKGMKPTSLLLSFPFALESFCLSIGLFPLD